MKKLRFALVGLFCCLLFQLSAQLSLGIKGGYTEAWEYYGDIELPEDAQISINGWNASLVSQYRFGKHFKIGFEPGVVRRGAACVPGWQPIFEGDTKFLLDYISTPIKGYGCLFLFQDKLELNGGLGYGASYLISAIREDIFFTIDQPATRSKMELNEDSFLNRWDHGVYGSLGFGYHLKIGQLFFESSFYHGFVNADMNNVSPNRNIDLSIGMMISL